jgi:hypothetical protein
VSFYCVEACGSPDGAAPVCVDDAWACPAGTIPDVDCTTCPAEPHGCCRDDGTFSDGSCIGGAWTCPPGTLRFGDPGCVQPAVCATLLPCALDAYCRYPDHACGESTVLGACVARPTACPGGEPLACGCDGATHASECEAASNGVGLAIASCVTPPGTFECGPLFCAAGDLCRRVTDLTKPVGQHAHACVPAPPGCPNGCGCGVCPPCPPGQACNEECISDAGGAFVTCTIL